ncbi:MAG: hypothetical protein HY842_08610, partial [Bacteroidetes bacterium]|nr:hypothetical protein [Bacteroidota bacterium]
MNELGAKQLREDVGELVMNNDYPAQEDGTSDAVEEAVEETEDEESVAQRVILPKDIHFIPKPLSLDNIIKRIKREKINFFTEYQRLPNLWDDVKKSRFIESIL